MTEYQVGFFALVVLLACVFFGVRLGVWLGETATEDRLCTNVCGEHWTVRDLRCVCLVEVNP